MALTGFGSALFLYVTTTCILTTNCVQAARICKLQIEPVSISRGVPGTAFGSERELSWEEMLDCEPLNLFPSFVQCACCGTADVGGEFRNSLEYTGESGIDHFEH